MSASGSGVVPGGEVGVVKFPSGGSHHPDPDEEAREKHFPYKEIKNVLGIEGSPVHQAALKEWDRKELYLSNKVDRKEKRRADLTNQIFNIIGFFSIFQGVVFTAVSQLKSDTKSRCGMVYVPALLSGMAAFVAIIGIWIKFSTLQELETSIHNEKSPQAAVAKRATQLRAQGSEFNFIKDTPEDSGKKTSSRISISISRNCVILTLILFTGLFILSYFVILCNYLVISK